MANFTKRNFSMGDNPLIEDCLDEDESAFAPEFMKANCGHATQLCCDREDVKYGECFQTEINSELDICNIWCSKPVSVLHNYCDAIKIYIFWPLLFKHQPTVIPQVQLCVEFRSFGCPTLKS